MVLSNALTSVVYFKISEPKKVEEVRLTHIYGERRLTGYAEQDPADEAEHVVVDAGGRSHDVDTDTDTDTDDDSSNIPSSR